MGSEDDFQQPIAYLSKTHKRPMYLFACSLGGIVSSRMLINDQKSPIKAAAFYGSPLSVEKNHNYFTNSGLGQYHRIFGGTFLRRQKKQLQEIMKFSTPEQVKSYEVLLNGGVDKNLNTVDDYLVAPMFGFKNKEDYREKTSVTGMLHKIKIPCFYLHSWDDIVIGRDCIPVKEFEQSENLILATTPIGGHCCHFESGRLGGFLP
jgi:predicted alpha/beta-fold hydrolase